MHHYQGKQYSPSFVVEGNVLVDVGCVEEAASLGK
jgi:hypothetical protein